MNYFITAIGTDSGKTVISAALAMALDATYWKPIQAGIPTDTQFIKTISNNEIRTLKERYFLNTPSSPHFAASQDGISISLNDFDLPSVGEKLIIEGAGGCLVPINVEEFVIDIAKKLELEVILVSNNYLGSINHTLLTLEYMKSKYIPLKGIIFNGTPNKSTEEIIMKHANCECIYKVGELESINYKTIKELSSKLKLRWNELGW